MQTVSNTTLLAAANAADETQHDFDFPQREAAFFTACSCAGIPPKNFAAISRFLQRCC